MKRDRVRGGRTSFSFRLSLRCAALLSNSRSHASGPRHRPDSASVSRAAASAASARRRCSRCSLHH